MGMFTRPRPAPDDEGETDAQDAANQLSDAVADFDAALLMRCTPDQRAAQIQARQLLADFVDAMWDDLKARGLNPADDPEYSGVAGLRDLTMQLVAVAGNVAAEAGDDLDAEYDQEAAEAREYERRQRVDDWISNTVDISQLRAAQATANPNDVLDLVQAIHAFEDDMAQHPDDY